MAKEETGLICVVEDASTQASWRLRSSQVGRTAHASPLPHCVLDFLRVSLCEENDQDLTVNPDLEAQHEETRPSTGSVPGPLKWVAP